MPDEPTPPDKRPMEIFKLGPFQLEIEYIKGKPDPAAANRYFAFELRRLKNRILRTTSFNGTHNKFGKVVIHGIGLFQPEDPPCAPPIGGTFVGFN